MTGVTIVGSAGEIAAIEGDDGARDESRTLMATTLRS
jgi:hypothetical protein